MVMCHGTSIVSRAEVAVFVIVAACSAAGSPEGKPSDKSEHGQNRKSSSHLIPLYAVSQAVKAWPSFTESAIRATVLR